MRRVAITAVLFLIVASCGDSATIDTELATPGTSTTIAPIAPLDTVASTTAPPATTLPATTAPIAQDTAPWGGPPIAADVVPEILAEQWERSEVKGFCSALYPSGTLPEDAAIRSANWSGGWAVAWDLPAGPGRFADGNYCADCGRGVFGLAGSHRADGDETEIWAGQMSWADGSKAGFGYEGLGDGSAGEPHLMYLLAQGEGCLYNVWSFLGEDHLLGLVAGLRFVEELRGEPTAWRGDIPAPDVVQLGSPAWVAEAPLSEADISDLYVLEWAGEAQAPASCPMLAFADLGDQASGAVIRRATNFGEMLVAWDRPDGPGHDGGGSPCADCGRGAVGLGTFLNAGIARDITHQWSDGSRAAAFAGFYGTEVHLEPAGFTCMYWLWSHLGAEHVDYLFSRLRRVDGFP
jgi:hypothetical protein